MYTDEQIVEICRQQELDVLGPYYLRQLRTELVVPVPFLPESTSHRPSLRFLMSHGLLQLFRPDAHMRVATRLLGNQRVKEQIETMVISQAPPRWIVTTLQRIGVSASLEAIQCYKQHYFDIERLSLIQVRAILNLRGYDSNPNADPDVLAAEAAFEKARRKDPRMAAAMSPVPSLAAMVSAVRIGVRPDSSAIANMASTARSLALLRMIESGVRDGFDDPMRAAQWASMAKVSGEILADVGSPEADFNSKLTEISLRTEEAAVPMLGMLSGGSHTVNMELEDDGEAGPGGAASELGGGTGRPSQEPPSR
jgi:hypothetical protein